MKKCTKCDISYADDKKFCKNCGSSLSQEYNIDPKELAKKEVYEEKLKADSLNTDLLFEYSQFLYDNLLFKEAVSNLLKILAINENKKQANELLFKCYLKLSMFSDARDVGKQLLESNQTDLFLLEELVNIETQLDNKAKAIEYYETILKLQPKNTKALYSKANISLENKELEKAINIFKELYKDGDRDRITIIYAGVDKCLSGNYKDATELLAPCLSENDVSFLDFNYQRGILYLIYSFCKTQKPLNKIDEWFSLLDFELLNNLKQPLDEEILAKTILEIINIYFTIDKHDINLGNINYFIDRYISKSEFCFTAHTKNILAEIWAEVSELQKAAGLISEAQESIEKAIELSPDNTEYENKLIKVIAIYKKKKKHRNSIAGSVFALAVLILLSVNLYNRHKESKAWERAKIENTYESYGNYLSNYPENKFSEEAEYLKEEISWKKANEINTIESYDEYLQEYPKGKFYFEASEQKKDARWETAIEDLKTYRDLRDGKIYETILIGKQLWMKKNLAYEPLVGNYWNYGNNNNSYAIFVFGYLYDWETAKKVCPSGWHLPSDAEWTELTNYLGGSGVAGGKLKETGTAHWKSPNSGATNETGFTALPGGSRGSNGSFGSIGEYGYWWSSSEDDTYNAWNRSLGCNGGGVYRGSYVRRGGFSVRCLRD